MNAIALSCGEVRMKNVGLQLKCVVVFLSSIWFFFNILVSFKSCGMGHISAKFSRILTEQVDLTTE